MDAPTAGVLRDTALLVWLALIFGVLAYQILRVALPQWITSIGKVQAGAFVSVDGVIVVALSMMLLTGLNRAASASSTAEKAAEAAELTLGGTLAGMVVQLVICVGLLVYLRLFRDLNPSELFGLRRLSPGRAGLTAILAIIPAWVLVTISMLLLNHWMKGFWPDLQGQDAAEAFRKSGDWGAKAMLALSAVVVAPLMEEIVFRGFIYGVLKRYTDGIFAALCSSLLFAIVHMHVGTMFPLAILAIAFCAAYEITGCLFVTMLMHGIFNATSLVLMILFPEMP